MKIEKVNQNQQEEITSSLISVSKDWIGGKAATIQNPKQDFYYRVILTSTNSDSVFNVEARTDSSLIKINDRSLKFEGLKQNSKVCYLYNVKNQQSNIAIESRAIKGEIEFSVFPSASPQQEISFKVENEKVFNLSANERKIKKASNGDWVLCAQAKVDDVFFTLSVYNLQNEGLVNEHKKLLFSKKITYFVFDFINFTKNNFFYLQFLTFLTF